MGTDPRHMAGVAGVVAGLVGNHRQRIIEQFQMLEMIWRGWRGFGGRVYGVRGFQGCEPEFRLMADRGATTPAIPANHCARR